MTSLSTRNCVNTTSENDDGKFDEDNHHAKDDVPTTDNDNNPLPKKVLEAKQVYILMSKQYRISRNRRAEWFFTTVNTTINFPPNFDEEDNKSDREYKTSPDFQIVSIIPIDPSDEWKFEERNHYRYRVTADTKIVYLSRRYRIVFCLDISPSVASVDVQAGGVVFDNIFKALQATLHGLLQPFEIPGSRRTFCPEIFLTVIAHTPFFTPVTEQVLIQGQILDKETCSNIIRLIFDRLNDIENKIAQLITKRVHQLADDSPEASQLEDSVEEDQVDGKLVEEKPIPSKNGDKIGEEGGDEEATTNKKTTRPFINLNKYSSFSMSPDFGLLDLLRQALIALSLMPENSSAGLVILTDGVISVPDGRYLDIILSQLRYNTVSCSFIQLSSPFHPHLCHGVLPYADLMKFIASATFGAFLNETPEIVDTSDIGMNVYHNAFLAWSFHKTLQTEWTNQRAPTQVKPGEWSVRNKCFFSVRDMPIVKKQQYENTLNVDHMKVMSCRLREGFTIKEVITSPETGLSEVTLILPWKFLIHLEYKIYISSREDYFGDLNETGYPSKVRCVVSLEGPYDFLHDVTCLAKKPFSSLYRQLMVNRFWATRKNLSESDRLLVHLNSFSANTAYYNIPESLKNGMPLFYWGGITSSAMPQLQSNEGSYPQFTHFWKPVCLLDTTVWQKWMHTHRIGVILEHDYPLPKHLHLPNSTGRFNVIQCRQAIMALNTLLKNMSSFVLLENQSYVHLMFKSEEDKVPHSFCLIRVTSKPPHVVLRLAFLVGTPGHLRHRTVDLFREKISSLTFPQRVKDPPKWRVIINTPDAAKAATTASPLVNKTSWSDMPCCLIVRKPVEKILIRYDKSPDDFRKRLLSAEETCMHVPEGKSAQQSTFGFRPTYQTAHMVGNTTGFQMLPEVFNTIARYLYHRRWIWWFPGGELPPLNIKWASEILATVTKMRLQEGFRFAYSSAGITNMVLELPMKNKASEKNSVTPMVLQFLVFPPTANLKADFEDLDSTDANDSLYLITECWVEPQCGNVTEDADNSDDEEIPVVAKNFIDLDYMAIPKLLFETDQKCISLVGTFEYLVRICSHKDVPFSISANQATSGKPDVEEHESVEVVPFDFDLKQILKRSGQVEILFSSFFQDMSLTFPTEWNASVCSFFERSNMVLYNQWCANIAMFQDKEVNLSVDQHEVATKAVLLRKGLDDEDLPECGPLSKGTRGPQGKCIQWRCFVRSSSSTHVLLTLIPATLKDVKNLLLLLDMNVDSLHRTKSSRYADFLEGDCANAIRVTTDAVVECPNQVGHSAPAASASSSSSPQLVDHHQMNCRNCQGSSAGAGHGGGPGVSSRKRVRAFSGGSECAPAVKKYLTTPATISVCASASSSAHSGDEGGGVQAPPKRSSDETLCEAAEIEKSQESSSHETTSSSQQQSEEDQKGAYPRSQTFSEGTVSGKLAHFMRAKRTLSDQSGGGGSSGGQGGGEQEQQDNFCSDPQRCSQLYDYLNRCGGGGGGAGVPSSTIDDSLRYVPCRPPVIGSLALCVFTYSCSLMSLTDHVVFKKLSKDELTKDYRVSREGITGLGIASGDDFDADTGDDDDELSSGSGSIFPNGRSISQESFSESSLQRLEAAEHESLLKSHCVKLKEAHLQAYILSAYRSLLSGYLVNPCDIQVVIDRCALTRVKFPLDTFLQFVCRHKKCVSEMLLNYNGDMEDETGEHEADDNKDAETEANANPSSSSSGSHGRTGSGNNQKEDEMKNADDATGQANKSCVDCCGELKAIHQFIRKRFRRLVSRNFTPATENGHVLFYKLAGSNALSDFSGFYGGGFVKCSSDLEDNIDSCSIVADSLCSGDDHYPLPSIHIPSDNETTTERSPVPPPQDRKSRTTTFVEGGAGGGGGAGGANTVNNDTADAQSFSAFTQASLVASSAVAAQCAPLFCYLTCGFQIVQEEERLGEGLQEEALNDGNLEGEQRQNDENNTGYIPLVDIPTCYEDLCFKYLESNENAEDELDLTPTAKFQLTMELTFLTSPDAGKPDAVRQNTTSSSPPKAAAETTSGEGASSGAGKRNTANNGKFELTLPEFQKRVTVRQAQAIDHVIRDIHWLMEDEINSFRGGGGGPGSGSLIDTVNVPLLEQISSHVLKSLDKMGCVHQQIRLNFVEHADDKGFQSFLERFNSLSVNEYRFQQVGMWWYLVVTSRQQDKQDSSGGGGSSTEEGGTECTNSSTSAGNHSSSSPSAASVSTCTPAAEPVILPPFWIILRAHPPAVLDLFHHCRYDENDLATLQFSRNLRVRIIDLISNLIRTINQDLLLQQLHDTRVCSPLLEMEDPSDLEEVSAIEMMMMNPQIGSVSKFGDSESDISSAFPMGMFIPGMFSCQDVWVTHFTLHSRLRSGGGKTAFARGIQTLRSTLTAFEVANRKNMFVYRDATGNVFYMRFYRGVDVLDGSSGGSPPKLAMDSVMMGGAATLEDYPESELQSMTSECSSSANRIMIKRTRNQDSESEKARDDPFDGILALKVHGIVPAGEEIKAKLVQSLRNKLDDAVLDILSVTLKRNPHCKLTPDDVHFLQKPRSNPDSVFKFKLTKFIVAGHLPAFSYYLHQNLLQFLSTPKYTSLKTKYHFQDYSRLHLQEQDGADGATIGSESSVYLYNQSPGGGGTGNRGIAIVSMALTDRFGNLIRNPEWRQPEMGTDCELAKFGKMIETSVVVDTSSRTTTPTPTGEDGGGGGGVELGENNGIMVEFSMWKQGRINVDLLKSHVDQAIKQAGWDLIMEFKVMTAPLAVAPPLQQQQQTAEEEGVFAEALNEDSSESANGEPSANQPDKPRLPIQKRRRSSHLNPGSTRSSSTGGPLDDDDEPRTRSMSFTGIRKTGGDAESDSTSQSRKDRAPSPVTLTSGRGTSEGSRPRILLSRSQSIQMSLSPVEIGEVGSLHSNYTSLLDAWLEKGTALGAPSLRRVVVPLNCRYPVPCIVQELEKIINQVAPDNTPRQFWKQGEVDYISYVGGGSSGSGAGTIGGGLGSITGGSFASGGRRDSGGAGASASFGAEEYSFNNSEYCTLKRHEKELLSLEETEEAEYPAKILNLFRKNENFQPGYKGHVCYLIARNLAHWKSCLSGDAEFALHTSQDFKNLYKYPPLLNENFDVDGSRGSIEKLPRTNFSRGDFVLWSSSGKSCSSTSGRSAGGNVNCSPILIPRQRFLRARVTCSEVDFVVYNWSKECCERLQEHVTYLSHWIQARASLLSSLLLQKSGIFYCQPILSDNFACAAESNNPFLMGDVDLKDLILNTPPTGKHERRSHHYQHHHHHHHAPTGVAGAGPGAMSRLMSKLGMNVPGGPPPSSGVGGSTGPGPGMIVMSMPSSGGVGGGTTTSANKPAQVWMEFYRNISLCHMLGMPEPVGENLVDAHGKQLFHVLNVQGNTREPENTLFQYWLTRGPSASNVITTQMLESFTQTARTIHFCLTPVMFLPAWRAAIAQTRDSCSVGGIIRRNRASSRRYFLQQQQQQLQQQQQNHTLHAPPPNSKMNLPPSAQSAVLQSQRVRHGSEVSQASSLASLRNRSKSYHSGMMNLSLHPEVISEKDFETSSGVGSAGAGSLGPSPQQLQQQSLFLKVKSDEPWHGVVCKIFLQEYMQYLQTLGFVPVHCKAGAGVGANGAANSPSGNNTGGGAGGGVGGGVPHTGNNLKRGPPNANNSSGVGASPGGIRGDSPKSKSGGAGVPPGGGGGIGAGIHAHWHSEDCCEEDERMVHFLQRCLPGGIIVVEVGLLPPFFYCKIHALEAKRIFPSRNSKNLNTSLAQKNAIQFVDECEKMKVLTHLHSFMYDFHLRAMFLYISGRQQMFKLGYHLTTFLDDFITYYPKCPNFSRNAVHIGVVVLDEVTTPSQVLFNYILGHDKYYRMKVMRMTPFNAVSGFSDETTSEYVLVHHMSRKVSYRSSDRAAEDQVVEPPQQQTQDEFDLTLIIAHDYPTSSRDFVPNYQGLRVKYYILLTSRRELYPKGDTINEPIAGKLCHVNTPLPLCTRHHALNCPPTCLGTSATAAGTSGGGGGGGGGSGVGIFNRFVSPPAPPPSYFDGFEGHQHFQHNQPPTVLQHHSSLGHHPIGQKSRQPYYHNHHQHASRPVPDMIREEKVRYMGYFSSHEQLMQKIIDDQKDTMEQFVRQLITKAAVDCRRDLLWQRLLGSPQPAEVKIAKASGLRPNKLSGLSVTSSTSSSTSTLLIKDDFIARETMGPLSYSNFNELLALVQVLPLNKLDPRLDELLCQPVPFYQTLIKVLMASTGAAQHLPSYNYCEFISTDHQIHQLAIFNQDAHKSIVMVELNMDQAKCDIYVAIKDGKKGDGQQQQQQQQGGTSGGGGIPSIAELGDSMYSLVEKVVNACCYTAWTTLI